MLKLSANSLLRQLAPTRRLLASTRAMFATDPFNNPYGNNQKTMQNATNQIKAGEFVTKNVGIHKFVTRIYNTTALSVAGALGGAFVGMNLPIVMMNPVAAMIAGGLVTIGSFMGVQFMKPTSVTENVFGGSGSILKTQNSISRIMLYSMGVLSLGISASPLFAYMHMISPTIIPSSLGITLGIFGGASAMAYALPKDKMLGYGKIFGGSLLGLIAMQLVGLGSAYFLGPNALSSLLFSIDNYAGILLFSGLIAYDTHVAIKEYEMGNADHLGISVQLLLDFWNLLIRVMQIMSRFKNN